MNISETVIAGTIRADGTLELDHQPRLPPGKVKVLVRTEDWWSYLQRARLELEQAGARFRSGSQIEFEVEEIRGESDRVEGHHWEQEWSRHHGEQPEC